MTKYGQITVASQVEVSGLKKEEGVINTVYKKVIPIQEKITLKGYAFILHRHVANSGTWVVSDAHSGYMASSVGSEYVGHMTEDGAIQQAISNLVAFEKNGGNYLDLITKFSKGIISKPSLPVKLKLLKLW